MYEILFALALITADYPSNNSDLSHVSPISLVQAGRILEIVDGKEYYLYTNKTDLLELLQTRYVDYLTCPSLAECRAFPFTKEQAREAYFFSQKFLDHLEQERFWYRNRHVQFDLLDLAYKQCEILKAMYNDIDDAVNEHGYVCMRRKAGQRVRKRLDEYRKIMLGSGNGFPPPVPLWIFKSID